MAFRAAGFVDFKIANQLANMPDFDFWVVSFAVPPERKPAKDLAVVVDQFLCFFASMRAPRAHCSSIRRTSMILIVVKDDTPMPRGPAPGRAR